jgi:hypothetical protein
MLPAWANLLVPSWVSAADVVKEISSRLESRLILEMQQGYVNLSTRAESKT